MPAQPTVAQYLASNADRVSLELTNEGKAILIALQALALGGASTVADGADVAQGAVADAAVAAGAAGSVSAKLRSISRDTGKDFGAGWTTVRGVAGVPFTSADQHSAVASVTDAPTSGQKLVITDLVISVDTAMSVSFTIESSATVIYGPFYLSANQTVNLVTRGKLKLGTADKKLQVKTSVAGNISVLPMYYSEA